MGDTIDSVGGIRTMGGREIAIERYKQAKRPSVVTGYWYSINRRTASKLGLNPHNLGAEGHSFAIAVSCAVHELIEAEITPEEREQAGRMRSVSECEAMGRVFRRLVAAGKLKVDKGTLTTP